MSDKTDELTFQNKIIAELQAGGWQLGTSANYNREMALYPEDAIGFVQDTQPKQWKKFCRLFPEDAEKKFLKRLVQQLEKADANAADQTLRTFGTLGVLRHEIKERGTRFFMCQFKPEHGLNPDTLTNYGKNRFRVVPELVYTSKHNATINCTAWWHFPARWNFPIKIPTPVVWWDKNSRRTT